MPFRDKDWEDFQRDCDFFPAYTDYIFGTDARPEVADEPGLHPQIYDPPRLPPQRIYGLPSQSPYCAIYDTVRNANYVAPYAVSSPRPIETMAQRGTTVSPAVTRELFQTLPDNLSTSLSRRESSLEYLLPAPALPVSTTSATLLRPGELGTDPQYSFIPPQERSVANDGIISAWNIINSDAIPHQKAKATDYIKNMSRVAFTKRQEYQEHEFAGLQAQGQQTERETELGSDIYAIRDISQLPAYVQSRLSQLWTCTELVALQAPLTNQTQLAIHRDAQKYLVAFRESVPPNGRQWVVLVIDAMLDLYRRGEDPLTVLKTMSV
jgi:hypothetical protein